jgi:putative tryptophan/tyrosine transport system substrate-binding protein
MLRRSWLGQQMQFDQVKRRQFMTLIGGAAAWPITARGQQPRATIGFLSLGTGVGEVRFVSSFRNGLNEAGYVEGRNVTIEFRSAENDPKRLPELAAELVARRVDVIVVPAGTPAVQAAKAATATIPIVFRTGADPVGSGLVPSLNHPGGNLTGVSALAQEVVPKSLRLLNEMKPGAGPIAVLLNPNDSFGGQMTEAELQVLSAALKRPVQFFYAGNNREIDTAFDEMIRKKVEAVLVRPSNLFNNRAGQIAILAARHTLPAMHELPEFTQLGGLMSYGGSVTEQLRQVGFYTGRILKGEKPGDLPVVQPTKFELVINLQTAKTLGIMVPPTLLAIADEVIE